MKLYSLENTKRDEKQDNLYDLIYPLLSYKNKPKILNDYKVNLDREMRIDLICNDIYGSIIYIDELMHLNGIIDPYSIKKGDIIKWTPIDELKRFRESYNPNNNKIKNDLNKNKNITTVTPNDNYTPVMIDRDKSEIIISNKLK